MDAEQVANDLAKHEAVCAERWKTAFNRFDDMDKAVKRVETILITAAGGLIVGGASLIVTMWTMHSQEKIMEMDYSKKDITKAPKIKKVVKEVPEGCGLFQKPRQTNWKAIKATGESQFFATRQEGLEWLTK